MRTTVSRPVRHRLEVEGSVQGVGFRPHVHHLASRFGLSGFVTNTTAGALIEVEGEPERVNAFAHALLRELPPLARITRARQHDVPPHGNLGFSILASRKGEQRRAEVTPDAATCPDCLDELFDPTDRRYRYPFINCTNCGPRYSIIRSIPYDRPATTMARFEMCAPCRHEYSDPTDRRFHAQPVACPACGPHVRLIDPHGAVIDGDAIAAAARLLHEGRIVAIKGIGGYHLACRADSQTAVTRLRRRKIRDGKPLALMAPDVETAERLCELSHADVEVLRSPAAPVLLAPKRPGHGIAAPIAPNCRDFGVMLPYAPLHHLLFAEGLGPLVMTSGNRSGQPLTFRDADARDELREVADALLVHDREIHRPIDDSVVFTFRGHVIPIRRARGYVPRPIAVSQPPTGDGPARILALGGELKNTVCLLDEGQAIVSEHLGDLTRPAAYRHFVRAIERLCDLFAFAPEMIVHDLHPQYLSTQYARQSDLPTVAVQHHHAHIASVLAEAHETGPVIGISCDGTGYGPDGTIWGGEILCCRRGEFERVGHVDTFPLIGGDVAAIETWRPAAGLLRTTLGPDWYEQLSATPQLQARFAHAIADPGADPGNLRKRLMLLERQIDRRINTPPTSSLGRVFDAVAFLLGLCDRNHHEAEAAMALEAAASDLADVEPYAYSVERGGQITLSVRPMPRDLLRDLRRSESAHLIAARFHETIAAIFTRAAAHACNSRQISKVALSGGCLANRRLLGRMVDLLEARGLQVLYPRQFPAGDGGLSLGQAYLGMWIAAERKTGRGRNRFAVAGQER